MGDSDAIEARIRMWPNLFAVSIRGAPDIHLDEPVDRGYHRKLSAMNVARRRLADRAK